MNIYHVGPIEHDWDEFSAFVVIAGSEQQAREAAKEHALFGRCPELREWREQQIAEDGDHTNASKFLTAPVTLLGPSSEIAARVVLGSFHAG
jgi:hypothetical protein